MTPPFAKDAASALDLVIGASANPDRIGGRPLNFRHRSGFKDEVFATDPKRREEQQALGTPGATFFRLNRHVLVMGRPG